MDLHTHQLYGKYYRNNVQQDSLDHYRSKLSLYSVEYDNPWCTGESFGRDQCRIGSHGHLNHLPSQ